MAEDLTLGFLLMAVSFVVGGIFGGIVGALNASTTPKKRGPNAD